MTLPSLFQEELDKLNAEQYQAVTSPTGPCLVSASAGTGKTRVLSMRYAFLFFQHQIMPSQILSVTFTNKAAQEMQHRIQAWISLGTDGAPVYPSSLWIGTFHHLSWRILRKHWEEMGFPRQPKLLDGYDRLQLVKKIFKNFPQTKISPKEGLWALERWKQKALLPPDLGPSPIQNEKEAFLRKIYTLYQEALTDINGVDFDDLILVPSLQVQRNQTLRDMYQRKFLHILVDEYQDINYAQSLWLKGFLNQDYSLFSVGDDDQAIYGWRGADIENILKFGQDFPKAQLIQLKTNYRSTASIVGAASALIGKNKHRYPKEFKAHAPQGEKVLIRGFWDSKEEAQWIGQAVQELKNFPKTAILVRASFQTREFEERFAIQRIPYKILGGQRFYDRLEVRDALAYLQLLESSKDSIAFERAIGVPKRGIGPSTLNHLYQTAKEEGCALLEVIPKIGKYPQRFKPTASKALTFFYDQIQDWTKAKDHLPPSQLIERVLEESGYYVMLKHQRSQETFDGTEARRENLKELIKASEEFSSLEEFLEHTRLIAETNQTTDSESYVWISTLHGAKGLEFDHVFLPGWEENIFPNPRYLKESPFKGLEEERRLAYVGLTRARTKATISFAWNRKMPQGWCDSTPSRFLEELAQSPHVLWSKESRGASQRNRYHQSTKSNNSGFSRQNSTFGASFSPPSQGAEAPPTHGHHWKSGQTVYHKIFGKGTIQGVQSSYVDVFFPKHGLKKIVQKFLTQTPS